jgi:hypothetical protein
LWFGYLNLSLDFARACSELVEPFRISNFVLRIFLAEPRASSIQYRDSYRFLSIEALAAVGKYLSPAFGSHPGTKTTLSRPFDFTLTMILHSFRPKKIKAICRYFFPPKAGQFLKSAGADKA